MSWNALAESPDCASISAATICKNKRLLSVELAGAATALCSSTPAPKATKLCRSQDERVFVGFWCDGRGMWVIGS